MRRTYTIILMCYELLRGKLLKYALLRPRCSVGNSTTAVTATQRTPGKRKNWG